MGHKDLKFGQIVYILVFYNISFSWILTLDGFQFIFLCRVYYVAVKKKNAYQFCFAMFFFLKKRCYLMLRFDSAICFSHLNTERGHDDDNNNNNNRGC